MGMKSAPKAARRTAIAAVCLLAIMVGRQVAAQVASDPYALPGDVSQAGAYGATGAGSSGASTSSGYGQSRSNAPSAQSNDSQQNSYGSGEATGVIGGVGAGSQYQPAQLPDYTTVEGSGDPLSPIKSAPQVNGSTLGAIYARPTGIPGQFQLLQKPAAPLGEFEQFVADILGKPLPRFGSQLVLQRTEGFAAPTTATVPADYKLQPGDELLIGVSGSVEARLRLVIDNEGRIFIPRVGEVALAGLRYGDLQDALSRRFGEQFKEARVSVVVGRLHGLTVYVTGFAVSPGAYAVSSLATAADAALVAGGPNAGGSFRNITLRRGGRVVTHLDLYDLLLSGDKSKDATLQAGDVINIEPVGPEVAISGSVNLPAIYEAKPGDTFADILRFAGGPDNLADDTRLIIRRLSDLDHGGSRQISLAEARVLPAERGSVVSVLSLGRVARPLERQDVLVTIEGEVDRPGRYFMPAGAKLGDLLGRAGGLTAGAFVYGTKLERVSVRDQEKVSYEKALDNLELAALTAPLSALNSSNPAGGQARAQAAEAVIMRLRAAPPDGRVVLDLPIASVSLPLDLAMENNDLIFVPPRPKTVGVFGAVFQAGNFLFTPGTRLEDYIRQSGGPQRIADRGEVFVLRFNGSVMSSRQTHGLLHYAAYPGDLIFVPVRTGPSVFDRLIAIAGAISQVGVTALTVKALGG